MSIDWKDIRYRGDAADVAELFETYRVGDYLATAEENRRQQDKGVREQFLKDGIRLSERLSPRIYRIFREVTTAIEFELAVEVYCLPDPDVNAFAVIDQRASGPLALVGLTSGALERLEDEELRSIIGHELAHFLFENNRLDGLLTGDEEATSVTVLPPLGESLFLRWQKKAELSADRVGLIASRDFRAAARSLIKATFGLSDRNLNLDVEALIQQVDELRERPELLEEAFASHPLLPVRLKALELFSHSEKAWRAGYPAGPPPLLGDAELESAVDDLVALTKRTPRTDEERAAMRAIALGGAVMLGADGEIGEEEVKILVGILHKYFTDEPELEITTDQKEILEKLPEAIEAVVKEKNPQLATFVLSRLADVALADGALTKPEETALLELAEKLDIPVRTAYSIIVGAAQASTLRADPKLNRITEQLRRSLRNGFGTAPPPEPKPGEE